MYNRQNVSAQHRIKRVVSLWLTFTGRTTPRITNQGATNQEGKIVSGVWWWVELGGNGTAEVYRRLTI
jgi:hypothetical protein